MNAEKGAVEATAETGAAGKMVVETTADGETTTVDSETTGAEETTGEETDNNAGPSTITIGRAPNAKTPTSLSDMSAIVARHHDQAVVVVNEENATIGVEETTEDDGTITVDSETTGVEETTGDDETTTADSETTEVEEITGDDGTITVDSETIGGPVATVANKGTTIEAEIAMAVNSEDDLRTDEGVHDLSIVAHRMFNPEEPKEKDRVMRTINPQEISEMLLASSCAEMTEWS